MGLRASKRQIHGRRWEFSIKYDKIHSRLAGVHSIRILNRSCKFVVLCFPNHAIPIFDEIWGRFWVKDPDSSAAAAPCKFWRASLQKQPQKTKSNECDLKFKALNFKFKANSNSAFWNKTVCNNNNNNNNNNNHNNNNNNKKKKKKKKKEEEEEEEEEIEQQEQEEQEGQEEQEEEEEEQQQQQQHLNLKLSNFGPSTLAANFQWKLCSNALSNHKPIGMCGIGASSSWSLLISGWRMMTAIPMTLRTSKQLLHCV